MRRSHFVAALSTTLAVAGFPFPAPGLTAAVQSVFATPGDTPDICVHIPDNDGQVSGIQMDLSWDPSCANVDSGGNGEAACILNDATGRNTFRTMVLAPGRMRALALSISDTSTIPTHVRELFCCQFRISAAAAGRTCVIGLQNFIAADPRGTRLPVVAQAGTIAVSGDGGPLPGPTPMPGEDETDRPSTGVGTGDTGAGASGGGCAIAAASWSAGPWLLLLALVGLRRRHP